MVKFTAAVAALVLLASGSADAFTISGSSRCRVAETLVSMTTLPTPEESAKALSDYMAKSHEEKLRAVKTAEEKSAAQIESLQKEIDELKSARESSIVQTSVPPPANLPEGSKEELAAKLVAYQKFMADYIVKAHEQKYLAVKAAEEAAEKKYQEKLLLLGAAPETSAAPASAELAAPPQNKLFAERSAKVSAAAKAGKSRWGDMENQRAAGVAVSVAPAPAAAPAAPAPVDVPVPPEVEAADHGLRADGGVGGPSLAERVALGSTVQETETAAAPAAPVAAASAPVLSKNQAIFQQRNAMVSAAAKAGKSRWGEMEIKRATDLAGKALSAAGAAVSAPAAATSTTAPSPAPVAVVDVPVPPEVEAADHGLRADGGVGGLTLAQRVGLGSTANGASAPVVATATPALSAGQVRFQKRNAMVSAAGKAGKSRWGDMEINRATELAANALPAADAAVSAAAAEKIEAADHGLRADGGVGGPSLGERVNLGAQLLQNA